MFKSKVAGKIKQKKINYKKKLWKIFSEFIRRKYSDENGMVACVTCGKSMHWKEIHAGHYHPRSDGMATYFEERNVHPQCAGCNLFKHGNLSRYAIFLREKYGESILEELDKLRRETRKMTPFQYEEMIDLYKEKLKHL